MRRAKQRGSAMLITMILITALLAGAAVLISLQMASNRSTDLTRSGISALYCAEAGLTATRSVIAQNQPQWTGALANPGVEPGWLSVVDHDLDNDGSPDFMVWIEDNYDETSPTPNDPTVDTDGLIFLVSKCTKYPDTPRVVKELVTAVQQNNCYNSQQGGCAGNNNMVSPY